MPDIKIRKRKMKKYIFLALSSLLFSTFGVAGDSQLGLVDKSLGLLHLPYSTAGFSRGFEIADNDSLHLNSQNYSFWADMVYTTYQVDANYRSSFSEDRNKATIRSDRADFQGGSLAIPILKKKFSIGLGLYPLTSFEYSVQNTPDTTQSEFLLTKGGLSKVIFNLAYNPFNWLGIAAAYEYNFGNIKDNYRVEFRDASVISFQYQYFLYGSSFSLSANARPLEWLIIGAMYRSAIDMEADVEFNSTANFEIEPELMNRDFRLPQQINLGFSANLAERYRAGMDFIYQDWESGYKINDKKITGHSPFYRLSAGIERTAGKRLFQGYGDAMDLRFGLFYGNQNLKSALNDIPEYGLSFGVSLPLQRFISKIDIGVLAGKRGDISDNYYEDTFFKVGISITTNERWFLKLENY
jgi:hypothetical protein